MEDLIDKQGWLQLNPTLGNLKAGFAEFCRRVTRELPDSRDSSYRRAILRTRREILSEGYLGHVNKLVLMFVNSVVLDLASQNWKVEVDGSAVRICPPSSQDDSYDSAKSNVRMGHLVGRDAQLREKSVNEFVRGMERRRLTDRGWHSIYSLMRDGRELSERLRRADAIGEESQRLSALAETISPYIQFVEGESTCAQTGLRLGDIWRYFRHTWVSEYRSMVGRSLLLLIRDAASQNHPVIGIAALGSSVVQNRVRDEWIGWEAETFIRRLVKEPTTKTAKWLLESLESLISGIYSDDLRREGICKCSEVRRPTAQVVAKLQAEAGRAMRLHCQNPQKRNHAEISEPDSASSWERVTLTHLYRAKRCGRLAALMRIRQVLQAHGLTPGTGRQLEECLKSADVRSALAQLVRMVKAEHVGIDMMDITVCGAIVPYNVLLGGKLVSMLLCSPEVIHHYQERYGNQVSIIASSMKGEPIIRTPNLVLLCTTSLYGVGSSQYNRLKIPADAVGGHGEPIVYKDLGHSCGFGTYHFSRETIELGNLLISRGSLGRRTNSIFGEGVSPLMRKMREALEIAGLPSDRLLIHGNRRVNYGVALASNFREVLLGTDNRPMYFIPQEEAASSTDMISDYWRRRWLSPRISRSGILDEVSTHTLRYPITHGAMVPLELDADEKGSQQTLWESA